MKNHTRREFDDMLMKMMDVKHGEGHGVRAGFGIWDWPRMELF